MQPIKAVLFDMDGTIINTIDDLAAASNHTMEALGFSGHTVAQYKLMVGNGIPKLVERALPPGHRDEATKAEALEVFLDYYREHAADLTRAYDGVPELIAALRAAGLKTAVVSNKVDFAVQTLAEDYFKGLFDMAVGEREGVRRKPAPDSVNEVMRTLGIPQEKTVYIGDSDVDADTARNACVDFVGVEWGFRPREVLLEHGATVTVKTADELRRTVLGG